MIDQGYLQLAGVDLGHAGHCTTNPPISGIEQLKIQFEDFVPISWPKRVLQKYILISPKHPASVNFQGWKCDQF